MTDAAVHHHPLPRPLRVFKRDTALGCMVSHVYGYRAECDCGFHGHVFDTVRDARAEARWHRDNAKAD